MANDKNRVVGLVVPLKLHDHRLQAMDQVPVGLAALVAKVELVLVPRLKVLGVLVFDLLVRQACPRVRVEGVWYARPIMLG